MDCIHNLLFFKLAEIGYPSVFQGFPIVYDFNNYEVDIITNLKTFEKIQKMGELLVNG